MCGIAAIFDAIGKRPIDPHLVDTMTDALIHRGPDGRGVFIEPGIALGHRRLSIIDIDGGAQPMFAADGKVAVDYALHGSITDWNERTEKEVRELVSNGVPTFKMFMIYREEGWMADDASLYQALEVSRDTGAQIGVHAESVALLDLQPVLLREQAGAVR